MALVVTPSYKACRGGRYDNKPYFSAKLPRVYLDRVSVGVDMTTKRRSSTASAAAQRHVVMLAVPPLVELDLIGPATVFGMAGNLGRRAQPYRLTVATTARKRSIEGVHGLNLLSHLHYSEIVDPIDTLLIAGSEHDSTVEPQEELCAWLTKARCRVRRIGSICVAAYVLAAAGLLNGRRATTHWTRAKDLATRHPLVGVDPTPIWIKDGNIYTSAGITSGIDLALALVEEDLGSAAALEIARHMVVFLKRPSGQAQFSVALGNEVPRSRTFIELTSWIADNLVNLLPVESLADRMAMSPRHFARVFADEMGVTPARYVRRARLERARILLEQTRFGLDEIAVRCGFGSAEVMRRTFVEELRVTPGQYRDRFETGP